MQRPAIQLIGAVLTVALVAGGYALLTNQAGSGQSQHASSGSSSQSQQTGECVKAGEPLYPSTLLVPLSNFTQAWGSRYVISVNSTSHTVLVQGANGVGAANVKSVSFELLSC